MSKPFTGKFRTLGVREICLAPPSKGSDGLRTSVILPKKAIMSEVIILIIPDWRIAKEARQSPKSIDCLFTSNCSFHHHSSHPTANFQPPLYSYHLEEQKSPTGKQSGTSHHDPVWIPMTYSASWPSCYCCCCCCCCYYSSFFSLYRCCCYLSICCGRPKHRWSLADNSY